MPAVIVVVVVVVVPAVAVVVVVVVAAAVVIVVVAVVVVAALPVAEVTEIIATILVVLVRATCHHFTPWFKSKPVYFKSWVSRQWHPTLARVSDKRVSRGDLGKMKWWN